MRVSKDSPLRPQPLPEPTLPSFQGPFWGPLPCPPVPFQSLWPQLPGRQCGCSPRLFFSLWFPPPCGLPRTLDTEVPWRLISGDWSQICRRGPGSFWELFRPLLPAQRPHLGVRTKHLTSDMTTTAPGPRPCTCFSPRMHFSETSLLLASKAEGQSGRSLHLPCRHSVPLPSPRSGPWRQPSAHPTHFPPAHGGLCKGQTCSCHMRKPSWHGPWFVWLVRLAAPSSDQAMHRAVSMTQCSSCPFATGSALKQHFLRKSSLALPVRLGPDTPPAPPELSSEAMGRVIHSHL